MACSGNQRLLGKGESIVLYSPTWLAEHPPEGRRRSSQAMKKR